MLIMKILDIVSLFSDNTIKTPEFITNVINNVGFGPDIGIYSKKTSHS